MNPCPFCGCKSIIPSGAVAVQMKCVDCGAEGPSARDAKDAEILWDRRPEIYFWKHAAAYFGSVHAANASEYTSKSVSKSRRNRQISILQTVAKALLLHENPEHRLCQDADIAIKAAGERADRERRELMTCQKDFE